MLGIRLGEFVEIILVNFPAESLTEVENLDSISPCYISYVYEGGAYSLFNVGMVGSLRMDVDGYLWE